MAPHAATAVGSGYAGLGEEEEEAVLDTLASPSGRFGSDRAHQSLDDLAAFFKSAVSEAGAALRDPHPVEAARKLHERVKSVTEVHIHRDKKKAAEFETIDYMPQDSEMYRKWLHTQPLQRLWDRWLMMFLIGIVVGLCSFCLHICFHTLANWKARSLAVRSRRARCMLPVAREPFSWWLANLCRTLPVLTAPPRRTRCA
jgi:hypothetical protein